MKSTIGFCAAMTVAAAGLLSAPVALAQQQQDKPASPSTTAPANIPDHKLDAAAAAAKKVVAVSDSYEQKLSKATDGDKEKIIDEANQAIAKAVTEQGLSVDEYVSIMKVAQNDPAVRDKLVKRLK
jgi:hypothetical protein